MTQNSFFSLLKKPWEECGPPYVFCVFIDNVYLDHDEITEVRCNYLQKC